jgi:hypothetical protein
MNDRPKPSRLPSLRLPNPLGGALRLWWRTWRAALAAEDTYETERAHGAAPDIAAREAFQVLTRHEPPERPETASNPLAAPAGGAIDDHDDPDAAFPLGSRGAV